MSHTTLIILFTFFLLVSGQDSNACFATCSNWNTVAQHQVRIGAYFNSLAALNVPESTIRFDLFLWIKWDNCQLDLTGEIFRPDLSLTLVNDVVRVDTTISPTFPEPICIHGNETVYYEWHVEGQFRQFMNYKSYPLDRHILEVIIEDNVYDRINMIYVPDVINGVSASGMHENIRLSGWTVETFHETEERSPYVTENFKQIYGSSAYSRYTFGIQINRGAAVYVLKTLPPIIITLGISGLMLLIDIDALDTRIATTIGALMTCVFLQLTYSDNLPPQTDYLTLLDWIFNMAYVVLLVVILECIYIRVVFYRLLLESQTLKDEIQLQTLVGENKEAMYNIAVNVSDAKRKKKKIKERIRKIERYFFIFYCILVAILVIIISLAGRFS